MKMKMEQSSERLDLSLTLMVLWTRLFANNNNNNRRRKLELHLSPTRKLGATSGRFALSAQCKFEPEKREQCEDSVYLSGIDMREEHPLETLVGAMPLVLFRFNFQFQAESLASFAINLSSLRWESFGFCPERAVTTCQAANSLFNATLSLSILLSPVQQLSEHL